MSITIHPVEMSRPNSQGMINSNNARLTEMERRTKELTNELKEKAPKVGYAPDLKVGFANELVGRGEATPQVIGQIRPTGEISIGDGNATIEKIKGNSVVWNQLVKNHDFSQGLEGWDVGSGISSKELNADGSLRVTYKGGEYNQDIRQSDRVINIGHTIIVSAVCNVVGGYKISHMINGSEITFNTVQGIHEYVGILEVKRDLFTDIRFCAIDISNNIPEYVDVYSAKLIDLTKMFGAGNEPTTIEEFEARRPLGVTDEYNEGEIISYDGANELLSIGFNAYNGDYANVIGGQKYHALGNITSIGFAKEMGGETTEVTLDSDGMFTPTEDGYVYAEGSDICIHLAHTYTPEHTTEYEEDTLQLPNIKSIKDKDGNLLFPYGLLSAGSAHDEISATTAVKRVGAIICTGEEEWNLQSINSNGIANFYILVAHRNSFNSLCDRFSYDNIGIAGVTKEGFLLSGGGTLYIRIKKSTADTVANFKEWLKNNHTTIYYELKEPIEVDLEEPLNLTYDAWDFGTEELHTEAKTTPLNADISYQFNAVDRIRENTTKASDLEARIAQLEAMLTQMAQANESNEV